VLFVAMGELNHWDAKARGSHRPKQLSGNLVYQNDGASKSFLYRCRTSAGRFRE